MKQFTIITRDVIDWTVKTKKKILPNIFVLLFIQDILRCSLALALIPRLSFIIGQRWPNLEDAQIYYTFIDVSHADVNYCILQIIKKKMNYWIIQ